MWETFCSLKDVRKIKNMKISFNFNLLLSDDVNGNTTVSHTFAAVRGVSVLKHPLGRG